MTKHMKIKTVVNEIITPICDRWAGLDHNSDIWIKIAAFVKEKTGKEVGFQEVTLDALKLAKYELSSGKTLSVNIICGKTLMEEFEQSSTARRKRFGNICNPLPHLETSRGRMNRFQINLNEIRGDKQFDIQYLLGDDGRVWPVAVIGYYGSNINGWSERVGLSQTKNPHSIPSTHYMSSERASEYVFVINNVANKFL